MACNESPSHVDLSFLDSLSHAVFASPASFLLIREGQGGYRAVEAGDALPAARRLLRWFVVRKSCPRPRRSATFFERVCRRSVTRSSLFCILIHSTGRRHLRLEADSPQAFSWCGQSKGAPESACASPAPTAVAVCDANDRWQALSCRPAAKTRTSETVKACATPALTRRQSRAIDASGQVLHKPRGRKPRRPPRWSSSAAAMAIGSRWRRGAAACDAWSRPR